MWLGVGWLALRVSYTDFEHGWFGFAEFIYAEDGLFETATAVIPMICSVVLLTTLDRAWALDRRLGVVVMLMAILCFLLLMEELSWGSTFWASRCRMRSGR